MIFYFSGTGNSLQAATMIGDNTGDCIVDISEAIKSGNMSYSMKKDEKIGFVFPTYYSGLPKIVSDFIEDVNITADDDCYIFGVLTCGSTATGADYMFRKKIYNASLHVDCCFSLKMPDNYIMIYNPVDAGTADKLLAEAESNIKNISDDILNCKKGGFDSGVTGKIADSVMQALYNMMRNTKKFRCNDKCISCGKCASLCPVSAIEMVEGKPVWIKQKCSHCVACISRCPEGAIQYGSKTEKRNRYLNPILK